jgi:hypothetical protein
MTYYILVILFGVACFVTGFLVGKKHGERVLRAGQSLADTIKKV